MAISPDSSRPPFGGCSPARRPGLLSGSLCLSATLGGVRLKAAPSRGGGAEHDVAPRSPSPFCRPPTALPQVAAYHLNRGRLQREVGNVDAAISDLSAAILLNPKKATAYCDRAFVWELKGNFDEAEEDYTQAIQIDPACAEAYAGRGRMREWRNRLDDAIADISRAIELRPDTASPYMCRGLVRMKQNREVEAQGDFDRCLALSSEIKPYLDLRIAAIKKQRP